METLSRWEVAEGGRLVAYDDAGGAFAARLWWMARSIRLVDVVVLDGGWRAWIAAGAPVESGVPAGGASVGSSQSVRENGVWVGVVTADKVQQGLADSSILLVDARTPERYAGESEPIDPVAGHIPGAVNRPFGVNLGEDGRFLPAEVLRAQFEALLDGRSPSSVVHMCGSGVTACHNLLAMERAGLAGSKLYAGSWSEWIRDPRRPVATGGDPG